MKSESKVINSSITNCGVEVGNRFTGLEDQVDTSEEINEESLSECSVSDKSSKTKRIKKIGKHIHEEFVHEHMDNITNIIQSPQNKVNFSSLQPEGLMIIPIEIAGIKANALVDSGASNNLVKESLIRNLGLTINKEVIVIRGLGNSEFTTIGKVDLKLSLLGLGFSPSVFDIVPDDTIGFDIILGVKYLKEKKLIVNMKKRKISHVNTNGARIDLYMQSDGTLMSVIHENIPLLAKYDVNIKNLETKPIHVEAFLIGTQTTKQRHNFYYEGKIKNKKVRGMDGILSCSQEAPIIMMQNKLENNNGSTWIRKGEMVGKISTLIELEPDDVENEKLDQWSEEDIREKVKLDIELSDVEKEEIIKLLVETQDAISKSDMDIGKARVDPHQIELTSNSPIWQKPRRFSEPVNKEIDRQCKELIDLDIIEYSNSQWSSPIVPVRKKDGQLRMCIDYRKLNTITKPDKFPMPNLSDYIYSAHNSKYFTKLDLVKGFYQSPLDENSRKYTAFSTPHNHYQFKRLSFGLKNSGIAFQKNMQQILSEFCFNNVLIYIDDILIMTETFTEHINLVRKVMNTLRNNGIKVKLNKCEFFREEVSFLGHLIGRVGIRKSPEFIEKIKYYPKPKTVTELRQFLGLVNFQRKFVDQCSVIGKALSELTGGPKKQVLTWTIDMDRAFRTLKERLVEEIVLAFPDYSEGAEKLEIFVDASGLGAGACLVQKQLGNYRTIGYASTTFSDAETRYSTIERELVAIRWGIQTFRSFLFGVQFILYTDHKPLVYLHNMSRENSRLMRTINELEEFDFIIKYRPGKENSAADAMSRLVREPNQEDSVRIVDSIELPQGLKVLKTVEGGGDSLFKSLLIGLEDVDEVLVKVPSSHLELREMLVNYVIENSNKFGIKKTKEIVKKMKNMSKGGQLPREEIILAACIIFDIEIWIHHGTAWPVIYSADRHIQGVEQNSEVKEDSVYKDKITVIHLQCISGIHFNPVFSKKIRSSLLPLIKNKNINSLPENVPIAKNKIRDEDKETLVALINLHTSTRQCDHNTNLKSTCIINVGRIRFCALIDTGAQVSLVSDRVYKLINEDDNNIVLEDVIDRNVKGINSSETAINGYVKLRPRILNLEVKSTTPFAVIKENDMPCCCILGANFLVNNGIVIDFIKDNINIENEDSSLIYPLNNFHSNRSDNSHRYDIGVFFGNLGLGNDSKDNDSDAVRMEDENFDNLLRKRKIKFRITKFDLVDIQNNDRDINNLKKNLTSNTKLHSWDETLHIFKRHHKTLRVQTDLLVIDRHNFTIPVVPFTLLTDIVYKVHTQMAHIGMHKLIDIISKDFWHPSLELVVRDICISCRHCQLYKVSSQSIAPPTIKIQANHPFDLVAIDLLQFPKSSNNNVAAVVCVDHFSKFLMAIPIKDKTAKTVTKILHEQVLPHLARLPNRILTDNGPEFRSSEFQELLDSFNIKHIFSTRYRAQGNGAVERSNRTITELIKGLIDGNTDTWDTQLHKGVIIYNTTWHSQINSSPADFILQKPHNFDLPTLPINTKIIETWKKAHPQFSPFKVDQKVALKINKIGNQLKYKLGRKFEGPCSIKKVQVNGISYEIRDQLGKNRKVHHKQLKIWNEPPQYLKLYLELNKCSNEDDSDIVNSNDSSSDDDSFPSNNNFLGFSRSSEDSSSDSSGKDSLSSDSEGSKTDVDKHVKSIDSGSSKINNNNTTTNSSTSIYSSDNSVQSRHSQRYNRSARTRRAEGRSHVKINIKANTVAVEKLQCSQPTINNLLFITPETEIHNVYNNKYIEWSFGLLESKVEDLSETESKESVIDHRCSSPIFNLEDNISLETNKNISPIVEAIEQSSNLNNYNSKLVSKNINITEINESFFEWIDQSLVVQELMIDRIDPDIEKEAKSSLKTPILPNDQESFLGFSENTDSRTAISHKSEALKSLRSHASYIRDSLEEYRKGGNHLLRKMWHKRYIDGEARLELDNSIESEASDIITPIPQLGNVSKIPQRITRSRGNVEKHPNVQEGTLEYKLHRK